MKIAFLSYFSGKNDRGAETFVHELSNELTTQGLDTTVYQSGPARQPSRYQTVAVKSSSVRGFTSSSLSLLPDDTDILFANNGRWQPFLCRIWCKHHRAKLIVAGHSGPGLDDRINLYCFPDCFVALSDFQYHWAKKIAPWVTVVKIPDGVNPAIFTPAGPRIEIDLPRPVYLCVAALVPIKRQDLAIKAVSKLKKGSLVLVGDGPLHPDLARLGNKLLPGRFKILSLPYSEIPAIYRTADVFTYPTSPWEASGLVLYEALASGLPVVASDDPIRREIISTSGVLVDPTDEIRYSKSLQEVAEHKSKFASLTRSRDFTWSSIAHKYIDLFTQISKKS